MFSDSKGGLNLVARIELSVCLYFLVYPAVLSRKKSLSD